jgi:hypothetical protein
MHEKTCLVPANDNRVPSWFETIEHEDDALDLAIGAAMAAEIITVRRCKCAVHNSAPGCGRDD